tara:strand:+ start:1006 stop:1368 length:363 start_codon:yes stop_codon:yes gene_type:complete
MTILGKFIFIFIILIMYLLAFHVARTNSIKALEKLFIIFFGSTLFFAIIFSESLWTFLPKILRVANGNGSILYLFIIVSLSVNLILLRKILELENNITEIVQYIALSGNKEKRSMSHKQD